MYTYNVTVKIESAIHDEWLHWMQTIHMPEVMATQLFEGCQLHQLLEPQEQEDDTFTFVAQYITATIENYMTYIADHAPALREKGFQKFGDRFIAFRSLLRLVQNSGS